MKKSVLFCCGMVFLTTLGLSAPASASDAALERFLEKQVQQKLETCLDGIRQVQKINHRHFVAYTAAGSYDASSDIPCQGNATWDNLAELKYQNGRYAVVNLDLLENLKDKLEFTYIQNFNIDSHGIATLNTLSYGKRDTQHHPRDKHQFKIRLSDMKVLSKKFTGRAPE